MYVDDFDYELPQELIAQYPTDRRDAAKMLVLHRGTGQIEHRPFYEILDYLKPGDCLVLNNSKVIPARIFGQKESTGANIEMLLVRRKNNDFWEVMLKPARKAKLGDTIIFDNGRLKAEVIAYAPDGMRRVHFSYDESINFMDLLGEIGKIPLPPYIQRESNERDVERYQTVYCEKDGSVAAPTAGLHFTKELLEKVEAMGVHIAYVTLHVGPGTFKPVKCENIEDHKMHFEEYEIDAKNAKIINTARLERHRVFCVGTTSARTLESAAVKNHSSVAGSSDRWLVKPGRGRTGIFIYPGYLFKITDSLITNFHLPKSTLLMLVSAMCDRDTILALYSVAIKRKYKFFSYGDAMLIL